MSFHTRRLASPACSGLDIAADQSVDLIGHCFLAVLTEVDPDKVSDLTDGSL